MTRTKNKKPITISSRYKGRCKGCDKPYPVGALILWTPGEKGAYHSKCSPLEGSSPERKRTTREERAPEVSVEKVSPGWVELNFPYHKRTVDTIKTIKNHKYDPAFRSWTVPDNEDTYKTLDNASVKYYHLKDRFTVDLEKTLFVSEETHHDSYPYLMKHQARVVHTFQDGHTKLFLGLPTGTGKSLASFCSMDSIEAYPLLIVCLSVNKINWQRELKKFLGKDSIVLDGRKPYDFSDKIVIINYDILDAWASTLVSKGFKGVIFDESTYIKNAKSKRTKAAMKVAEGLDNIIFLSGTPTPASPYDLVPPLTIMDRLKDFGGAKQFAARYCPPVKTQFGTSYARARNLSELHKNLKNTVFIAWKKEELIDLPDINIYDQFIKGGDSVLAELADRMKTNTVAEAMRVLTEAKKENSGIFAKMRAQNGDAKTKSIIEEAISLAEDDKVVVAVHHRSVNDEVYDALSKKFKTVQIIGGMSPKKRQEAIDSFQDGDARVLVMSIVAGGIGINLQNASNMLIGELPITWAEQDQAIARIYRAGQKNKVSVIRMVAPGTIDDALVALIDKKNEIHESLANGEEMDSKNVMEVVAKLLCDVKRSKE